MDNGEYLFENCHVVTLTSVRDWLLQSPRPFLCIYNMFLHSFAIKNTYFHCMQFLLCVYSFSGQQLPSGNQGREKKPFHLQTRPSLFIQTNPSCIPICGPSRCLRSTPQPLLSVVIGVPVHQRRHFSAVLPHVACFLEQSTSHFCSQFIIQKSKMLTRSTKIGAIFALVKCNQVRYTSHWCSVETSHTEVPELFKFSWSLVKRVVMFPPPPTVLIPSLQN